MKGQLQYTESGEIAVRLRDARKAKRLSQADFAQIAGVSLNSQNRYEAGLLPPLDYLLRLGDEGIDWIWIVTGQHFGSESLTDSEQRLVDQFRLLPEPIQSVAIDQVAQLSRLVGSQTHAAVPSSATLHDSQTGFRSETDE